MWQYLHREYDRAKSDEALAIAVHEKQSVDAALQEERLAGQTMARREAALRQQVCTGSTLMRNA